MSRNGARWLRANVCSNPSEVTLREANSAPALLASDVDVLVAIAQLLGERADAAITRQVGDVAVERRAAAGGLRLADDGVDPLGVAPDDGDLDSPPRELDRGRLADPPRRSGEHH